jgi:hypothetical protein
MEDTTETRVPGAFSTLLAGLQAGMVGALWMLAWLGVSSSWQNRGFWNSENLFATAFYGSDAVRSDFGLKTLPGLALYLLLYSVLGGVFALVTRDRVPPLRLMLAGMLFALGWFYLSFHLIWKSAMPLVYLLYSERPMVVGHLLYGVCVGRFPAHDPGRPRQLAPASEPPESEPPASTGQPEDSQTGSPASFSDPPVTPVE